MAPCSAFGTVAERERESMESPEGSGLEVSKTGFGGAAAGRKPIVELNYSSVLDTLGADDSSCVSYFGAYPMPPGSGSAASSTMRTLTGGVE